MSAHHIFLKNQKANTDCEIDFVLGVAANIIRQYQLLSKASVVNYFTQIVTGISARIERPQIRSYFRIIDTEETNAIAALGGYIFIILGGLKLMHNEA